MISLINEIKDAGSYSIFWNGKNDFGEILPGGMYIYRIESDSFSSTKKLLFIK